MKLLVKKCFSGRKRSQSPSPSRNASPNRALSPSNNRARDRSVSPLRYINLPMSKLARVTEELESLIHPTASTVHEEDEEEEEEEEENGKEASASIQQEKPTIMQIVEPEESIVLPQVSKPIKKPEEVPASIEQEKQTTAEIVESEESIILPQIPAPIAIAAEEEKKVDMVTTEVSY
jgi:hypothetical protein